MWTGYFTEVAQFGRALVSKTRCREFESLLPCKKIYRFNEKDSYLHKGML